MRLILILLILVNFTLQAENNQTLIDNKANTEMSDENFGDEFEDEFTNSSGDEEFDDFDDEFSDEKQDEEIDPFSGYNRAMTYFNDALFEYALFPVARGYRYVMPEVGRIGIDNFFTNLKYPVRFVNNLLQLKIINAADETVRFLTNSTVGILGFFDPAKAWFDVQEHNEDFGQTLGYYGVGGGFHIVWPILGPSNLRDSVGLLADWQVDPFFYQAGRSYNVMTQSLRDTILVKSVDYLNQGSFNIEKYESLKKDAIDLYPLLKDVYNQYREKQIKE